MKPAQAQTFVPDRFVADTMLGRLARWLRMSGYDTKYFHSIADEELIKCSLEERRWLLTRDRYLAVRKVLRGRHTLVRSDGLAGQLAQLRAELGLLLSPDAGTARRCTECNEPLSAVSREHAFSRLPPFVAIQHDRFLECRRCRGVYWPGTHWTNVKRRLADISDFAGARHGDRGERR